MSQLAELRSAATESMPSLNWFNELRKSGNAKNVVDALFFNYNDRCYSNTADSILKAVKIYSDGFVKDIATRYQSISNGYEMSQKQQWCIAFAFIKIQNELGEEII